MAHFTQSELVRAITGSLDGHDGLWCPGDVHTLLENTLRSRNRQAERNGSRFSASPGIVSHLQMVDGPVSLCLSVSHQRMHIHTQMHGLLLEFQVTTSCSWLKPLFTGPPNVQWHMLPSWDLSITAQLQNSGAQQKSLLRQEVLFFFLNHYYYYFFFNFLHLCFHFSSDLKLVPLWNVMFCWGWVFSVP